MLINKKNQISFFIIIGILIIFLMVFLISSKNTDKTDDLKSSKNDILVLDNAQLNVIKSNVDNCLSRSLKSAVVFSGLRGGFIYDMDEYYFNGIIPTNTYSKKFISNLKLNWNTLKEKSLVYSQKEVYIPGFSSNDKIYHHSIEDDLMKFTTIEFLKCLDLESTKERYYLNYTDYLGKIEYMDSENEIIKIKNIDASIGDKIEVIIDYKIFNGTIFDSIDSLDGIIYEANVTNLSLVSNLNSEKIKSIDVLNLNKSLNITIINNMDDITIQINYPINIFNNETQLVYKKSSAKVNVRYKALVNEIIKKFLNYKYFDEKNVDYSNKTKLIEVLNESSYFRSTSMKNFKIEKINLINEDNHKRFLYSIIDNDSKIFGNPFVLNFAYENNAPEILLDSISKSDGVEIISDTNTIVFTVNINTPITYNLRKNSSDVQYWDFYSFRFIEQNINGPDSDFSIDKYGNLNFKAKNDKRFSYEIRLTDTETINKYTLVFVTDYTLTSGTGIGTSNHVPVCSPRQPIYVNASDIGSTFKILSNTDISDGFRVRQTSVHLNSTKSVCISTSYSSLVTLSCIPSNNNNDFIYIIYDGSNSVQCSIKIYTY